LVVVDVLDAIIDKKFVHSGGMAGTGGSGNRFAPILFAREDQARGFGKISFLLRNEQIGAKFIKLLQGAKDRFHFEIKLVQEHRGVPGGGKAEKVGVGEDETKGAEAALTKAKQEPALGGFHGGIVLFDERDNELFKVTCLASMGVGGVIGVPGLFLEAHLDNDYIINIMGVHIREYAKGETVLLIESLFNREDI